MRIALNPNRNLFSIPISYVEEKKDQGPTTFRIIKSLEDKKKWGDKVLTVMTYWRSLTWKEHNIILRKATRGEQLDVLVYRDTKLKMALKRIEEDGEVTTVTDSIIDNLDSNIAKTLLEAYDEQTDPDSKDLEELRDAAYAYFTGKSVDVRFVQYFHEHQIAKHYNWRLDDIRAMEYYDFQAHLQICISRDRADQEFDAQLAGAKSGGGRGSSSGTKTKRFDPNTGTFV